MSIQYTPGIGTATKFGAFGKVLLLWQGSVYKLVFPGLALYILLYFLLSIAYRFFFTPSQREKFEELCVFCEVYHNLIPLSFVLAFYVSTVVSRWWDQWCRLPWPDNVAFSINAFCRGMDDEARLIRRSVTRYTCLGIVMTFRYVSSKVFKRFPTLQHVVEAGLLTEDEREILEAAMAKSEYLFYCHWIPFSWASSLVHNAYQQGYIKEEVYALEIQKQILTAKGGCGDIISYDWINLPLAYTQTVTLAVYTYFGFALFGRQYLDPEKIIEGRINRTDYVVPVFTILQFLFYVGWLKVAEALINPFGEDDDDFDMNWMVDRHLQVSYMIIDDIGQFPPQPTKDMHWDIGVPEELPYTVASLPFRGVVPPSSSFGLEVSLEGQQIISSDAVQSNEELLKPPEKQSNGFIGSFRDIYGHVSGTLFPDHSHGNHLSVKAQNGILRRSSCVPHFKVSRSRKNSEGRRSRNDSSSSDNKEKGLESLENRLNTIFIPTLQITREESRPGSSSTTPNLEVGELKPDNSER